MSLKFCANLSFMFQSETSDLLERYRLAKNAGFKAVEVAFPYDIPKELLKEVKERTGLEQVLLNTFPGKNCNKNLQSFSENYMVSTCIFLHVSKRHLIFQENHWDMQP